MSSPAPNSVVAWSEPLPRFTLGHPLRRCGGVALCWLVLFSSIQPSLALAPPSTPSAPQPLPSSDSSPNLARGLVFLRVLGPSAAIRHYGLSGSITVLQAVMLDDPARTPQPLIIEQLVLNGHPWLLLTRQLSIRHREPRSRYHSIQTLQILSAERLSAPLQLIASLPEQSLCRVPGLSDATVVAIRSPGPRDSEIADFQDLLKAWRVDRRSLRLLPLDPTTVRCRNTAQGVP